MRDEDKPFVCYKQGWNIRIVPRNAAGWRASGLWVLGYLPLLGLFIGFLASEPGPTWEIAALAAFLAATFAWVIAMIRWMYRRSEVVDVEELLRLKRGADRAGTGRRRS
ncbi:MAG: hypothetical protein ACEQR8_08680 [Cypionkella sp.]